MNTTNINNKSLAYEARGSAEPVLLMHCGFVADAFAPLMNDAEITSRYRLINYHRLGYGQSDRASGPMSVAEQAADARALLRHLGIERAHVVGHSYGGVIALQLALDAPDAVQSLALLEPSIPAALADPAVAQLFMEAAGKAFAQFGAGDKAGAVDTWLSGAFGPGYREIADRALPDWFEQAARDADVVFQVEAPNIQQWTFTPAEAARITQPVLSAYRPEPNWPGFQKTHDLLQAWMPQIETAFLPIERHLLQIMNPRAVAEALAGFFARHPMRVYA
ncbi:MAG: alpha/beta hydrolase [Chloroflexi bacterium]|nr:alpha/beta hydrolase [Chloroflexota bacterium]